MIPLAWLLDDQPLKTRISRHIDFIVTHHHPLWNGRSLEDAVAWTRRTFARVRATHPGRLVLIGETGWATAKLDTGEQGKLIKGRTGEEQQAVYCRALAAWSRADSVTALNLSMVRTALESEEKAKEVLEKLEADVAELEQDAKNIMMAKVLLFRGM